jgi:Terminase large subunit, T4likevirus-type, N-terminal
MTNVREIAYRVDPVLWVREELGMTPSKWQEEFLRAPRGSSHLVLTARQVGKSTAAAWAMAHAAIFMPRSLSVVACPTQRQSVEAVRKVRDTLLKAGAKLVSNNGYGLELENGSRVLALPGSDDSVRGLTVNAYIIADEAARLTPELIAALRPMRARCPDARLAMLSTAWSRTDPFWSAWESNGEWIRLNATIDADPTLFPVDFLKEERASLGEEGYKREYRGIPIGGQVSPFTWEMFQRATQDIPRVIFDWPKPVIIAHDVGRSRDRSTAVCGGICQHARQYIGIKEFNELPLNLFGSARADALAVTDRHYDLKVLIIADLSNDSTYAETLVERFGQRVIGLHIGRHGDGMDFDWWQTKYGGILVYKIGRTYLFDLLFRDMQNDKVRLLAGPDSLHAYEQLMALEIVLGQNGLIYNCLHGHHDDLAISCAMLVWAAQHPHLEAWCRPLQPPPRRTQSEKADPRGWT